MARNKDSEEEVYYMEKILDKRIGSNGKLEYLIAWENFGPDENSWEPESNILCPVMLKVRGSHCGYSTHRYYFCWINLLII